MQKSTSTPFVNSDDLVRDLLHLDPEALASLASGDAEAIAVNGADDPTAFDGLAVFMRRVMTSVLAIEAKEPTCVRLMTERQARQNGWPDARIGNLAHVFAWAMITEGYPADMAFPPLVEADEAADAETFPGTPNDPTPLASWEAITAKLYPLEGSSESRFKAEQGRMAWKEGKAHAGDLRIVPADVMIHDWLGLDGSLFAALFPDHFDPTDPRMPAQATRFMLAWVVQEALRLFDAMRLEQVETVRLKTDLDAQLACYPGAAAANLALLVAAALFHGWIGYTVAILRPRSDFAESLIEAATAFGRRDQDNTDDAEIAGLVMLKDLCAREYVHVGRSGSRTVAWRIFEQARTRQALG